MRKKIRVIILIVLIIIWILYLTYLGICRYYRHNFAVNTWINDIYCTGKSVDEVNKELIENTVLNDITLVGPEGEEYIITTKDINLRPDYTKNLIYNLNQNDSVHWIRNINNPSYKTIDVSEYNYSEASLEEKLYALPFVQDELNKQTGCTVLYSKEYGFIFYDGNEDRLDYDAAIEYAKKCIENGMDTIDLRAGGCYGDLPDNDYDKASRNMWNDFQTFFTDHELTYDMGAEKITLTSVELSQFLILGDNGEIEYNEDGSFVINEEKVTEWVENLVAQYDTVNTTREFQSTRGDIIEIPYDTYGTKLDYDKELEFLLTALNSKKIPDEDKNHIPTYIQEGYTRGLDDIGNTYIEVDMTTQHMYYYVDGELMLDTDVVTGCTGRRNGTPVGINVIYFMQRNRVLRGPDYATPVKYWVAVRGHVGIHDANWRGKFGGEIYKTNGSHGCINTPTKVMSELYDMVEVGIPVLMFY